jgi:hypothetical protein
MADEQSNPTEEWRQITAYGGQYQVSSLGRVRRPLKCGGYKVLKGAFHRAGYPVVCMSWGDGKQVTKCVHVLVCTAFCGPIPNGLTVNHINAIKTDNRPENLEIISRAEQVEHEVLMGLCPKGESHGRAKLTDKNIELIRWLYRSRNRLRGQGHRQIAKRFGISKTQVGRILRMESWRHLAP